MTAATATSGALLDVEDLSVHASIEGERRLLVSEMALHVAPGETIGIVGESGSGKSITAKALMQALPPAVSSSGSVVFEGEQLIGRRPASLRRLWGAEMAMVFQDPFTMLNPLMSCGQQIVETLRGPTGRKLARAERAAEAVRRLAEVGIHDLDVARKYPFELSGGMRQRVGIAASLVRDPRLLIADEPTTALDVTTQRDILTLLRSLQESRRMGLILITHDLRIAFSTCDRVYVMYAGRCVEIGPASAIESEPLHPYTLGLLLSEPEASKRIERLEVMAGSVPRADDVAGLCAFAPRCRFADEGCQTEPRLEPVEPDRLSACRRVDVVRAPMAALRAEARERLAHANPNASEAEVVLRVSGVGKVFPGRRGAEGHRAVDGVSLELRHGETLGLVGESGSGKTTVARCLLGLELPTEGTMTLGLEPLDYTAMDRARTATVRREIQIVFQDPYSTLSPALTIGSTLRDAVRQAVPKPVDVDGRVEELLGQVGLSADYAKRKPASLSGGQRQRVAIARALAVSPSVLVCDEPVSALDVSVQAQILNLLNDLKAQTGVACLFVSHDMAVVRQVADQVCVLHRGHVVESGPTDVVMDHPQHEYTRRLIASIPGMAAEMEMS